MDLSVTRNHSNLTIDIYRKPTTTDITIHYKSNHPAQHKMGAYRFLFNRLYQLPLSQKQRLHEMKIIHQIAKNNGYPINIIERLNSQIKNKFENPHTTPQTQQKTKKWAIFEYHDPIIQKVTNIFKGTDLHITYQVKNTTQRIFN